MAKKKNTKKNKLTKYLSYYNFSVFVLGALAIYLGFLIFKSYNPDLEFANLLPGLQTEEDSDDGISEAGTVQLTGEDELDVLNFPGENATQEEKEKHGELVRSLGVMADVVKIGGCEADPLVLTISEEGEFSFTNPDDTSHTIVWGEVSVNVPANGKANVSVSEFAKFGLGDYGYTCDGNLTGIVNVVPGNSS